jgi:hypothetical protein
MVVLGLFFQCQFIPSFVERALSVCAQFQLLILQAGCIGVAYGEHMLRMCLERSEEMLCSAATLDGI